MDKKNIIKGVVKFGAGCCVSTMIGIICRQNIVATNVGEKIAIAVGSGVIGMMVGEAAESYVGRQIDDICDSIDKIKKTAKGGN